MRDSLSFGNIKGAGLVGVLAVGSIAATAGGPATSSAAGNMTVLLTLTVLTLLGLMAYKQLK